MNADTVWRELDVRDIARAPLDVPAALDFVSDPAFGGIAMFVGRVRDLNHGRAVTGVSYDIFAPLALATFAAICEEARAQWGPRLRVHVSHAHGRLGIGDIAVVVAVGAPHRDEAFQACRHVIEAVKHRAPIWKREHYADGDSAWSQGCALCGRDGAEAAA
ncbi:MAG: molybdenum cofactor biosynthesis protein MoaE [Rehaibacterium terrae]|uniref:molybdenum cofactor biosynthesis protein MoaE n=1 Tax=Rehaibacterium terrae TaxID=1341696 RepID=UPI00391C207B